MAILTFTSLAEAIRAGYQIYDRTPEGFIVRARTESGWVLALVLTR